MKPPLERPPVRVSRAGRLARFLSAHPVWCLTLAAAMTIGALLAAHERLRIETDLQALLPRDSGVAAVTREALTDFGGFDFMYAVLESTDEDSGELLRSVAPRVATALDDHTYFREVTWRLDSDLLELAGEEGRARLVALMTEDDWGHLDDALEARNVLRQVRRYKSLANTPGAEPLQAALEDDLLGASRALRQSRAILRGPLTGAVNGGYFIAQDERMLLLLLWPVKPSTDLLFADGLRTFLEDTRSALYERNPSWQGRVRISFHGAPIESVAEADLLRRDARYSSALAIALIVVLFAAVFRRPEALVITMVPSIAGVVWTVGLAALVYGRLTQFTAIFSAILVGLGVDFAVHIYNRFLEAVRTSKLTIGEAVNLSLERTARANLAGAMTTAIAFLSLMATRFLGLKELGFVVGTGILMGLLASMLLLPALLRAFGPLERRPQRRQQQLPNFGLGRMHYLSTSYPRICVLAIAGIIALLATQARRIEFAASLESVRQIPYEYERLRERIESRFATPGSQLIMVLEAPTLDEALLRNDRLYRNLVGGQGVYPLLAIDSLRTLYPSPETQRASLLRMANLSLVTLQNDLERIAKEEGVSSQVFAPMLTQLAELQQSARMSLAAGEPVIKFGEFRNEVFERQVQKSIYRADTNRYRVVTQVYPPREGWGAGTIEGFIDAMGKGFDPPLQVTGLAVVTAEIERLIQRDLALTVLVMFGAVSLYMLTIFRDPLSVLLAMLPPLIGSLSTLGVARMLSIELNFLNLFAFPVIVGIGIDGAIHLMQRYGDEGRAKLRLSIQFTGRAIMLSSLSTALGFASLLVAGFQSVREIGILITVGSIVTLFLVLLALPVGLSMRESPGLMFRGGEGDVFG